jgi:hypothetical protein
VKNDRLNCKKICQSVQCGARGWMPASRCVPKSFFLLLATIISFLFLIWDDFLPADFKILLFKMAYNKQFSCLFVFLFVFLPWPKFFVLFYLDNFEMTRIKAPFSSLNRWLSFFRCSNC